MGAWDASLFGSDDASDVRDDYVELIENGVADDEAQARVLEEHLVAEYPEMNFTIWLALAATQLRWGRLDDLVKQKALGLIDSGVAIEEWRELGASKATLTKRQAVLQTLRDSLVGPQIERVEIKPRKHETQLRRGAVLGFETNGHYLAFHVSEAHPTSTDIAPVLDALPWSSRFRPPRWWLWLMTRQLQGASFERTPHKVQWLPSSTRVHVKAGADYDKAGFELLRSGDPSVDPIKWTSQYERKNWTQLAEHLHNYFKK